MKLTEQQLAQMFQQSKNVGCDTMIDDLYRSTDASDKRLTDVEAIANNSTASAGYQVMNQLHDWSQAVGTDIQLSLKPKFSSSLFAWFKPTVATAALVTAVYFVTPQLENAQVDTQINVAQKSDVIMFNSNFEGNSDVIKDISFESEHNSNDRISKSSFG